MKRVRLSLNILVNVNEKIKDIYFGQFLNSRVFILGGSSWETNAEFCILHTIKSQSYLKDFFAYSGESNVKRKDQLLYCYAGLYPKYNQVLCKGDFPYFEWKRKTNLLMDFVIQIMYQKTKSIYIFLLLFH